MFKTGLFALNNCYVDVIENELFFDEKLLREEKLNHQNVLIEDIERTIQNEVSIPYGSIFKVCKPGRI